MATALQQRLLHMSVAGIESARDVADLAAADWAKLLIMAQRHRLGPLLHWRLGEDPLAKGVPKPFAEALAANFEKHARRAVELQAEVSRIQRIMRENEIPAVFLRGAFLAFHCYRQPGLRPLRGLNVLVPVEQVEEAAHAVRNSILRRPGRPADLPTPRIDIEFHARLTDQARRFDPAFDAGTWNRLISRVVAEEEVWYLSPEDQLLHLILNALHAGPRNCHPLVLADIAQLLEQMGVNWVQFWQLALAGNWVSSCWLMLNLARQFHPSTSFQPPEGIELAALPTDLAAVAATVTLGEPEERLDLARQLKLQVRTGPLQFVRELLSQKRRVADALS
jgi:hypothetical protein